MMLSLIAGITSGQSFPVTYTSCAIDHTLTQIPSRVITMDQGVTEFMLAMGLADRLIGIAGLDDEIWPRYASDYNQVPVLSSSYPTEARTALTMAVGKGFAGWVPEPEPEPVGPEPEPEPEPDMVEPERVETEPDTPLPPITIPSRKQKRKVVPFPSNCTS
jgi:hypothetical protein